MNHNHQSSRGGLLRSLFGLILLGSLAIAAYFLIAEHRAHIFGGKWTAPVLLLAFVGLHLLMHVGHSGHGGHGRHGGHSSRDERQPSEKEESDNER